jgi:hypothetical protein
MSLAKGAAVSIPPPVKKWKDPLLWVSIAFPLALGLAVLLVVLLRKDQSVSTPVSKCKDDADCSHSGACKDGACVCAANWTGDKCQIVKTPPLLMTMGNDTCSRQPQSCADDGDCALKCKPIIPPGATIESQFANTNRTIYTCQTMSKEDNAAGLEGSFCMPPKPASECASADLPGTIAGTLTWRGWAGVDAQGWSCASEFPSFYPQNQETGACELSSQVCRKGKWRFPCDGDKCDVDLSPEQQSKLMHTSPLFNGRCVCDDTDCTSDLQCVTKCVGGKCAAQRTGLDPLTGLPTCVADTCWNNPVNRAGEWIASKTAPYTDGFCRCASGATITDQGCQWLNEGMIRPPAFLCPNNCSGNGRCVAAGKCECKSGYMGASCEQFSCAAGCFNQGECIGPNTCTCRSGYVYSPDTHECQPPIICYDTPTVGAAPPRGKETQTETIQHPDSFRNSTKTDCVRGSAAELRELCTTNGWDDVNALTVQCVRYPDCSTIECDSPRLCTAETKQIMPLMKVAAGDGCRNPSLDELNDLCDDLSSESVPVYTSGMINGTWQCLDGTVQKVLELQTQLVKIVPNGTLSANMCVDPAKINITRDAPFYGVYRLIRGTHRQPPNVDPDDETDPNEIWGAAEVFQNTRCTKQNASNQNYVGYSFLAPTPEISPPITHSDFFYMIFYLIPHWAASIVDPKESLYNNLGKPLYSTMYGGTQPNGIIIYGQDAAKPTSKQTLSPPALAPAIASKIAGTHDLALQALNTVTSDPTINTKGFIEPGNNMALSSLPVDKVVVAACTPMYCNAIQDSGKKKIVIIAWEDVQTLPASCAATGVVKYNLTSVMYDIGTVNTLVTGASRPNTVKDDVSGKTYRYFVDVVLAGEVNRLLTYTLTSFVAQDAGDTSTTPDNAPCSSMPEVFNVILTPYTDEYCASIPSPYPDDRVPNMHWLQNSMCFWERDNQAASDYYCAIARDGFDPRKLQLVTSSGTACGALNSTFPTLTNDEWGTAASCELTAEELLSSTPPPGCSGLAQRRSATCNPVLGISGGGNVAGADAFETRLNALNEFYQQHGSPDRFVDDALGTWDNRQQLYNTYFNCGPKTANETWGGMDASIQCDPADVACLNASVAGQGCSQNSAGRNKCSNWSVDQTDGMTFTQERRCYPPAWQTDTTDTSVCCSGHGTFSVSGGDTACFCSPGAYMGPTCSDLICSKDNMCNNHGTCGINEATGKAQCNCDEGYYNVDAKSADDMWEAPANLLTCNKNLCKNNCTEAGHGPFQEKVETITYPEGHIPRTREVINFAGYCNNESGLCECADGYGCFSSDIHKEYNGMCVKHTPCEAGNTDKCIHGIDLYNCPGTYQTASCPETEMQFCSSLASKTPFTTIQLPNVFWERKMLTKNGSNTMIVRHMLIHLARFQADSNNITLDLHMQVALGDGSGDDHLLASFVVLDEELWTNYPDARAGGNDIPGMTSTDEWQSDAVFNLLQQKNVVVGGTYPKTKTLPNYDVQYIGRKKTVLVDTKQSMSPVTVNKFYDVFIYLGISANDNITVRMGRQDNLGLKDSFIRMYQ